MGRRDDGRSVGVRSRSRMKRRPKRKERTWEPRQVSRPSWSSTTAVSGR